MKRELKNIPASPPLLCWDIFIDGYQRLLASAGDINYLNKLSGKAKWQQSWSFEDEIIKLNKTVLVTDSTLRIAYATSNIFLMNGYKPSEVIGKTPQMFQGKDTSADTRKMIKSAIIQRLPFEAVILNYCKNGEPYNCHINAFPIFNHKKILVNFIAFENIA